MRTMGPCLSMDDSSQKAAMPETNITRKSLDHHTCHMIFLNMISPQPVPKISKHPGRNARQTLLTRALATGVILILALVREPGGCYSGGNRSERDPPSRKNCGNKKLKTPFRTLSET